MAVNSLGKPANTQCQRCDPGTGCNIYPTRPDDCKVFDCLWLTHLEIPNELRPDRCKVLFTFTKDGKGIVAHTDSNNSVSVFNTMLVRGFIDAQVTRSIDVILVHGDHRRLLTKPQIEIGEICPPHGNR